MAEARAEAPLRVLMLEDEPDHARIIEHELRKAGLEISARRVETREAFIGALDGFDPHVILVDYKLPSFDGLSAVKIAKERRPDTPAIVVTGSIGEERAAELLREGARDYVLKDRLTRLAPAVRRALEEVQRANDALRLAAELRNSEVRYRRLFEAAGDGVLILDAKTGMVEDANPFICRLLGYSRVEILGKKVWELTPPAGMEASRQVFEQLQAKRYVRTDDMPLQAKDGSAIDVEFALNLYDEAGREVAQCNIRDIRARRMKLWR